MGFPIPLNRSGGAGRSIACVSACLMVLLVCWPAAAKEGEIRVAVSSNFSRAAQTLAQRFQQHTGHRVRLAYGSTGKQYAQIRNGAPFHVFLAADEERPALLEEQGVAIAGSRFTYAIGMLVLWSPSPGLVDEHGAILANGDFRHLAVANPRLAPYGRAAREVLEHLGLWDSLQPRMVRGENIGQAYRYVASRGAELGFVAAAQVVDSPPDMAESRWQVPQELYSPIRQQAVLLDENSVGRAFVSFLQSDEAKTIIRRHGYEVP